MTNRAWSVGEVDLGTLTSKGERLRRTKSILIIRRQKKRIKRNSVRIIARVCMSFSCNSL